MPAVPVWVSGAFQALPRGSYMPKFRQVTLDFGAPVELEKLAARQMGYSKDEQIARALREEVIDLAKGTGHAIEDAAA